jgi:hypothetical protein
VSERNEVASRPVRLGALHRGLREITDGLKPGEQVIVNGLQQVRPGVTVAPKLVEMPASNPDKETRRQGDKETRRKHLELGGADSFFSHLVTLSPCHPVTLSSLVRLIT